MSKQKPLAISLGDPAGIGPEVVLKALVGSEAIHPDRVVIFGDRTVLYQTYDHIKAHRGMAYVQEFLAHPDSLTVVEPETPLGTDWTLGIPSAQTGGASFVYLEAAIAHTLAGRCGAVVTAPIAKSAWKAAGYHYPGQTELLGQKAGVNRYGMLFAATSPWTGWSLRVLLATTHIPLRQVPDALTPALLSQKLDLLIETLASLFGLQHPRIAIAGLNPHSGEQGQLGREEVDGLLPWLEQMRDRYPQVTIDGPIPPDTMWVQPGQAWFGNSSAENLPVHDAYLALYHDQGLIPVKLMAFDRAVNTTIGLPFLRTSPDHGTAFDIAGKGIADATSMKAAITFCQRFGLP